MKVTLKKRLFMAAFLQVSILVISFLYYKKISIISYINISFCVASFFIFAALLVYTIQGGFFDVMSRSVNFLFSRNHEKRKLEDIPRLSQIVTIDKRPLLFYGFFTGLLMVLALFLYYFLLS